MRTRPAFATVAIAAAAAFAPAQAGEESMELPDSIPEVTVASLPDFGSVSLYATYDFNSGETGSGIRFAKELGAVEVRLDYEVDDFDFDEGKFSEVAEVSTSFKFDIIPGNKITPYLVVGGGTSSIERFDWMAVGGLGLEYAIAADFAVFVECAYEFRNESDDQLKLMFGGKVPLSVVGRLLPTF